MRRRIRTQPYKVQRLAGSRNRRPIGHVEVEAIGHGHLEGSVFKELSAGSVVAKTILNVRGVRIRNTNNVQAGLRIRVVHVMRCQQPVTLRSHIADVQLRIPGKFALDAEVVLGGILGAHMRLKIPIQQDGFESGPVLRRARLGSDDAVERVEVRSPTILRDEWRVELRLRQEDAAAERRLRSELFENQLFNWVVEQAPTGADAGLA